MLKELQDYAIKVLEETNTKHKVKKNFTEDNRHVSDTIFVKKLPSKLKDIGYYLSVKKDKNGYYFICQPTISYKQGQKYGYIPNDLLEQITITGTCNFDTSVINNYPQHDEDGYENAPTFLYKEAPIDFNTWMSQIVKVYGCKKGNIAISFSIASMFRGLIQENCSFFPHLYLSGEKGSGKSKFGDSIHNLFTYKLAPFDLNSGTLVGFYRRLAGLKNVPAFFEEYHDKIDDKMFQSLKAAYDNRGRQVGRIADGGRAKVIRANCSIIMAGQYLPSRDDNSIDSRSIIEMFVKKDHYTENEIEEYNTLKKWENKGLSSLILEVLQYRNIVEHNFQRVFLDSSEKLRNDLAKYDYSERKLNNYTVLYTIIAILYDFFEFPFTLEEFYAECVDGIIDHYN